MSNSLQPEEAAQALREIGQRREQIVDSATIPAWYWPSIGVAMVAFAVVAETRQMVAVGVAIGLFVPVVLYLTGRAVLPGLLRARLRNDLLGWQGVCAILGFVFLILAVTLPTAFALDAAGNGHAAVIGVSLGAIVLGLGGPILMRYLRRLMLAHRVGGDR